MSDGRKHEVGGDFRLSTLQNAVYSMAAHVLHLVAWAIHVVATPFLLLIDILFPSHPAPRVRGVTTENVADFGPTDLLTVGKPSSVLTVVVIPGAVPFHDLHGRQSGRG